ncbi:hypothetical protein A6769_39330 [Nostoc punctiforme NIES-2108]|uniref:Uncharacterized protein n=1 Tax=Nostoc punctiforme NIES-2108 TaxID=1356359 RepID=A0A367RY53_NOSPU|nr:hypothetical protein A6769_39330 [Nostoc punctiforme NIES-2108]
MNPVQLKQITVKASRVRKKLRRRFDLTQSTMPAADVRVAFLKKEKPLHTLTWFEVTGYTVLLEPDIALGKYRIGHICNENWTFL